MSKKIGVLIKEPGKKPRHVNISCTLDNLQKTVGGYIETVSLETDLVVICDEEGRLKGKTHCCKVSGVDFGGTIIMCGKKDDEFDDLPVSWESMKMMFPNMWEE